MCKKDVAPTQILSGRLGKDRLFGEVQNCREEYVVQGIFFATSVWKHHFSLAHSKWCRFLLRTKSKLHIRSSRRGNFFSTPGPAGVGEKQQRALIKKRGVLHFSQQKSEREIDGGQYRVKFPPMREKQK